MGKQPNPNIIDEEVRDLVYLLNEAPFLETCSSCSGYLDANGHPKMLQREWRDGWITMRHLSDAGQVWNFLDYVRARLDNTRRPEVFWVSKEKSTLYTHRTSMLFNQVGAEALYASAIPILTIGFSLGIWPLTTFSKSLLMWNIVLESTQEFLSLQYQALPPIDTPKAGAETFVKLLRSAPYIQEIATSKGIPPIICRHYSHPDSCQRVEIWFLWSRTSCQWGWEFMNHLKVRLDQEDALSPIPFDDVFATLPEETAKSLKEQEEVLESYRCGVRQFFLESRFIIKPIVHRNNLQRTREAHLKIWKLIELAAREYIRGELI